MKKQKALLVLFAFPSYILAANTIICPSVQEANQIFHDCKITLDKESCQSAIKKRDWVLDSPVESIYGGEHQFNGFSHFQASEILSGSLVCKYENNPSPQPMGWIIGSRYLLDKHCHFAHSQLVLGIASCRNSDPKKCQVICD